MLHQSKNLKGFKLDSQGGAIGNVNEFLIDDETWSIRYLIINSGNWLPGKRFLVSPQWISSISWAASEVFVTLDRDVVRQSPEYLNQDLVNRDYEMGLHSHYNRRGYWVDETVTLAPSSR